MATQLYAGRQLNFEFEDSMAKAIEDSLTQLLGTLPSAPLSLVEDRRALFIAISRGVINHLKSKEAAFRIEFNVGLTHVSTTPDIDVLT